MTADNLPEDCATEIFKRARKEIADEGVFSQDQITLIQRMLYTIETGVKALIVEYRG